MKRLCLLLALLLLSGLTLVARPGVAEPRLAEVAGTVVTLDENGGILTLNTRLGSVALRLTPTTLVLVNNRAAGLDDVIVGDEALVSYVHFTREVDIVEITRQARRRGTIQVVGNQDPTFRLANGGILELNTDAGSRVSVAGVPTRNVAALNGMRATLLYEPETFRVLSLSAEAVSADGRVTAVDPTAGTLTVSRARGRSFTFDSNTSVRRGGDFVPASQLVIGDRVSVAFLRGGRIPRALAINARPASVR